jgi:fused signal recognition particle receptor
VDGLRAALDRQRQDREAEGRAQASELDSLRQEREAARLRSEELEAARARAEAARDPLVHEAERLRADLEAARHRADALAAERDAERSRAEGMDAERTGLRRQLADALREQRAAAGRLEAEVRANRDQGAARSEGPPGRSEPASEPPHVPPGDAADGGRRVEELATQLRLAQEANERLRSFLAVLGAHGQSIGNAAK